MHGLVRKRLVDFKAEKTQLVSLDRTNIGTIYVKVDESVLEKNHLLRFWD